MTLSLSQSVKQVPVSGIRQIFERANRIPNVIRLEVGEPDFATPEEIATAAKDAVDQGFTHYTSSAGIPELREAIAEKLKRENHVDADPATEIVVTPGAGGAIYLSMLCVLNPGDEVLIPDPAWPHYEACAVLARGRPVRYGTHESLGFRPKVEEISNLVTPKTRAIVLNSPSNPTGAVLTENDLRQISEIAIANDLIVISDEIYEKMVYDDNGHFSIASLGEMKNRTITINSVSKTYAMTGWRVGYAAARSEIISEMVKANLYTSGCASSVSQRAALRALSSPYIEFAPMLREYTKRRRLVVERLNQMQGVTCVNPGGAFYVFPKIAATGRTSFETSMFLLDSAHVSTVPGSSFGQDGEGHIRLSYAASLDKLDEAMTRIDKAIRERTEN